MQEQYVENTDEANPFAARTVTTFVWHVQDHQENGREDWLTQVFAPNKQPYVKVTALMGYARITDKEKQNKSESFKNNKVDKGKQYKKYS